jgi:hypothetical protein
MMVSLTGPALLLPLAVISIFISTIQEVDAFASVAPSCSSRHATPLRGSSYHDRRTDTKHSSLHTSPLDIATSSGIVESTSAFTLGDTFDVGGLDGGVIFGAVQTAVALTVAQVLLVDATTTRTNDEGVTKEDAKDKAVASPSTSFSLASRRVVRPFRPDAGVVGRRSTLTTLIGGAIGFAASDMILGAAGNLLIDVGGGVGGGTVATTTTTAKVSSSVYGVQWNALFRRIATASAKHEAAIASPELVSWISKSPAALANPELRAWIAAQRAFQKGRQAAALAAVVLEEEGMAATATRVVASAAAAVASKQKSGAKDSDNGYVVDDVVYDDDDFDTSFPSRTGATTSTTSFKLKSADSEFSSPISLSDSTCMDLAQSELPMKTSSETVNNLEPAVSMEMMAEKDDDATILDDD